MKVMCMEKNLDLYIRKLIELDKSAVEFKSQRDAELRELELRGRNELKSMDSLIEKAASEAKQKHDEIVKDAKRQAEEMEKDEKAKIGELQKSFLSFREDAAADIWRQLLNIER
jgi:vacuolar-type H+-ATPase subunit H